MKPEIPNYQVKDSADQYMEAWKILNQLPPGSGVLLPLLNTGVVAIELYLKCMSSQDEYTPLGAEDGISVVTAKPKQSDHKLKSIFNKVPEAHRRAIKELYATISKQNPYNLEQEIRDFDNDISNLEGAFMQSRYPYEKGFDITKFDIEILDGLCIFLSSFVSGLQNK